jgi:ubiquinone/menaquinone biosynthesis C-methylase UbiE
MKRINEQMNGSAPSVGFERPRAREHAEMPAVRRERGPRRRILESSPVHVTDEAAQYDQMVRKYAWLLNRPFVNMLGKIGLEHARVLDIGTGPGWIPIELAVRHPGWEIWALDASEDMLERARRHAKEAGVADRIHFICGNATELPFETGFFDMVVSHFMLHHIEHPEKVFNETARVAHGGAKIVIKDLLRQPTWKTSFLLAFSQYVLGYSELQLQMYRESIDAGLTFDELRAALKNSKLRAAQVKSFRGLDYVVTA